ncbi:MAG: HEAT repeat domain-containing protein [Spirochaetota bacterium]
MVSTRLFISFLFASTLFIQCAGIATKETKAETEKKDLVKQDLFRSGHARRVAVFRIQHDNREDLLAYLPAILRAEDTESETKAFIVQVYFSYGKRLDTLLPDWQDDLLYVVGHNTDPSTLHLILEYALQTKDKRFFYPITELIRHRNMDTRTLAYRYLASLKDDRAIPYILELTNTNSDIDKYYYLEAMRYVKDERTAYKVTSLLQHHSHAIRSAAIQAIASFHLEDAYRHVVKIATADRNYEVRKYAIRAIAKLNLKRRSYILKKTILNKHPEVREESTKAIISFRKASFARYISQALAKETESDLKMLMVEAMLKLGKHGGSKGLIKTLGGEKSIEVRARAAFAIGRLRAKRAIPQLISSLKNDRMEEVKISVADSLGFLKEKSAVPSILDSLNNEHETLNLKLQLVSTLDQIDEPKVMPIIFDLIEVEQIKSLRKSMKQLLRSMLYRYYKPNYSLAIKAEQVSVVSP